MCPGGVPSELWLTDQEFKFISDTLVDSSFKVERLSDEVSRPLAVVNVSQPIPKPKVCVSINIGSDRVLGTD